MVVILADLYVLHNAYIVLEVGLRRKSKMNKLLIDTPVSLNLAWVFIATILNFSLVLETEGWRTTPDWACAWLLTISFTSCYVALIHADIAFVLITLWGLAGIFLKQDDRDIRTTAATFAALLVAVLLIGLCRERDRGIYDKYGRKRWFGFLSGTSANRAVDDVSLYGDEDSSTPGDRRFSVTRGFGGSQSDSDNFHLDRPTIE